MTYDFFNLKKLGGCKPLPANVRFEQSYVPDPNSGCWLWLGTYRGSNHYGSIKADGKFWVAHRYSWYLHYGEFDESLMVCHRCDVSACVNPKHLFLGTGQINSDDKVKKNRQAKGLRLSIAQGNNMRCGESSATSILNESDVISIRSDLRPQWKIAQSFGVTQATISSIKLRKTWRHI